MIMLRIIMEIIVILSCPLRLQEEHKDPFISDQDNYRIQESSENKSSSKWKLIIIEIIMEVIVILSCHLRLQEEHKDPFFPDKDNYRIQDAPGNKSCSKWIIFVIFVILQEEHFSILAWESICMSKLNI